MNVNCGWYGREGIGRARLRGNVNGGWVGEIGEPAGRAVRPGERQLRLGKEVGEPAGARGRGVSCISARSWTSGYTFLPVWRTKVYLGAGRVNEIHETPRSSRDYVYLGELAITEIHLSARLAHLRGFGRLEMRRLTRNPGLTARPEPAGPAGSLTPLPSRR